MLLPGQRTNFDLQQFDVVITILTLRFIYVHLSALLELIHVKMSATHVHPNPGYSDYETNIRRAAKVPELLSSKEYNHDSSHNFDTSPMAELSEIKAWSKRTWSGRDRCETTYQFQYCAKDLDERTKSAPTERERLNKPHPKQ